MKVAVPTSRIMIARLSWHFISCTSRDVVFDKPIYLRKFMGITAATSRDVDTLKIQCINIYNTYDMSECTSRYVHE
jgi:hypothetical protein